MSLRSTSSEMMVLTHRSSFLTLVESMSKHIWLPKYFLLWLGTSIYSFSFNSFFWTSTFSFLNFNQILSKHLIVWISTCQLDLAGSLYIVRNACYFFCIWTRETLNIVLIACFCRLPFERSMYYFMGSPLTKVCIATPKCISYSGQLSEWKHWRPVFKF